MKLQQLKCPNCDGTLEMKVRGDKEIYCPFCGEVFLPEENVITYNYNEKKDINKKYNLSFGHEKTEHEITKEAEIEALRQTNEVEIYKYKMMFRLIVIALLVLAFIVFVIVVS